MSAAAVYRQRGRGPQVEPYPPAEDGREGILCVSGRDVASQAGMGTAKAGASPRWINILITLNT